MLGFLFKSTTYFILWKRFQKQIITIVISIILVLLISSVYDDLHEILKVSDKDSLIWLLLFKWFIVLFIIGFNIYKLKRIKLDDNNTQDIPYIDDEAEKNYQEKSQKVLRKKKLITTTDLIMKKYEDKQ